MTYAAAVTRRITLRGLAATSLFAAVRRASSAEPTLLRIGGTGMALAAMQQVGDAFGAGQSSITVRILPSLGTGGGLSAVAAGAIDFALAARGLNDAERAKSLASLAYARTPIAFVTHKSTRIEPITFDQVARILAGELTAWPDGTPIRLIRREPSDADWAMLRTLGPALAEAVRIALERPGLLTVATDQENADALERLPGSFGAMSLGQLRAEDRRVIPFVLEGAPPTVAALSAGQYPLSRTLHIAWRGEAGPDLVRFLSFLRDKDTGALLTRLGHIPLTGSDA